MGQLLGSECFFYGGIALMAASVVLTVLSILIFTTTGRKLKRKLEQDYGKPVQ